MNPLTDELSDEAKAELAAVFADLKRRFRPQLAGRIGRAWIAPSSTLKVMQRRGW